MKSFVYINNGDFSITYELDQGEMFLHCEVKNFSLSIFKEIKVHFYEILKVAFNQGLDYVYSYTTNVRFCKSLMDCEIVGNVKCCGKDLSIIEWSLIK